MERALKGFGSSPGQIVSVFLYRNVYKTAFNLENACGFTLYH